MINNNAAYIPIKTLMDYIRTLRPGLKVLTQENVDDLVREYAQRGMKDVLQRLNQLTFASDMLLHKIQQFEVKGSWQENSAPHIWEFIHVFALFLDRLPVSVTERKAFVHLVKTFISCSLCLAEYEHKIPSFLVKVDEGTTLEDIFLAFHGIMNPPTKNYKTIYREELRKLVLLKFNQNNSSVANQSETSRSADSSESLP